MYFLLYAILSCLLHIYNNKEKTFISSAGVRLTSLNCSYLADFNFRPRKRGGASAWNGGERAASSCGGVGRSFAG